MPITEGWILLLKKRYRLTRLKFRQNLSFKLYLIGVCFALFSLLELTLFKLDILAKTIISIASGFSFAGGFLCWLVPIFYRRWHTPYATLIKLIIHGAVLLLTIVPARFIVAESLKLPPQDFDWTVSVLTIILYIPTLFLFFSLLAIAFFICAGIILLCDHTLTSVSRLANDQINLFSQATQNSFLGLIIFIALCGFGIISEFFEVRVLFSIFLLLFFISNLSFVVSLQKRVSDIRYHIFGAAAFAIFMVSGWQRPFDGVRNHPSLIKKLAYVSDYQNASMYPGVDTSKRFLLHENGIVSYAVLNGNFYDGEISITVEKVKDEAK